MAQRFYAQSGRIIMSKPGYNAEPGLPDQFKIFDSAWAFGTVIIASGSVTGSTTVHFTPQHFVPLAEVTGYERRSSMDYINYQYDFSLTSSSLSIEFLDSDLDRVDYVVWGLTL